MATREYRGKPVHKGNNFQFQFIEFGLLLLLEDLQ